MRRVPNNIQNKVIKWFDYLWLTQKSSDEEKAVSCLPGKRAFINVGTQIWTTFNPLSPLCHLSPWLLPCCHEMPYYYVTQSRREGVSPCVRL